MVESCECMQNVAIYRKRDRTLRITVQGPGDLTGGKVWFSVKTRLDDLDVDALITKKNTAAGGDDSQAKITRPWVKDTDPESLTFDMMVGIVEIYIEADDTEDIGEGDYWFDVVIEVNGRKLEAVSPSKFRINQPVTMT